MLRIFKHLTKVDVLLIILIVGLVVVQSWLEITIPNLIGTMTNHLGRYGISEGMAPILINGGLMLGAATGSLLAALLSVWLSTRIGAGFAARVRASMFSKVEQFSVLEVNKFSPASLLTRSTNDVQRVQMFFVMGVRLFIRAPVTAIWALILMGFGNWQFLTVIGAALALMVVMVVFLIFFALPKFKKVQSLTDDINRLTRENLSGIRVVRAYNAQNFQEEKFEKANKDMVKNNLLVERAFQIMNPALMLLIGGVSLGAVLITAFLIYGADIYTQYYMVGEMITFSQLGVLVIVSFVMMIIIFSIMPRAVVSGKRILEVLDTPSSVVDGDGVEIKNENLGDIEFNNVSFKYPDAEGYVLKDISFKAKKGETVAFIGSTGSGKSSLINLVPRFYDATDGEILVSGAKIKDYKIDELNKQIGYVSQKGIIFSGTIKDNIAIGEKGEAMTNDEVLSALDTAQASDFVSKLEKGIDAPTAQGGTNLSGGQKQRVSIARALAKKSPILIFDDSFSALDYKTDRLLRDALKQDAKDSTKLIVAQRIGTILDADQILVLDKGSVVGKGTHKELLKTCSVYQEIAYSQLSKEELSA